MTVNAIYCQQQDKPYSVIAQMSLPSLWPSESIDRLQVGLSQALARQLNIDQKYILACTQIVDSGLVVESGEVIKW